MRLKIDQWEVCRAVEIYLKDEYGFDYNLVDCLDDWPLLSYQEKVQVFKKHKNGKVVKNENGYPVVDHTQTTYKPAHIEWKEFDSMTLYLTPKE